MFQPAAKFLTMSVSSLISYATKLICSNGGSMDYRELHRLVTHYFNDSDSVLLKVLRNKTRFVVAHGKKEQASGDRLSPTSKIFAKTSLRMCKIYPNGSCDNCRALHLCKYFVYQNCMYDNGRCTCRNSHELNSDHNSPLLRYHHLQDLEQTELFQLLMQNDVSLLPEVCPYYNKGDGDYGSCSFKEKCSKLHVCQYFMQGNCKFGLKCKRSHKCDENTRRKLEDYGLGVKLIQNLPLLYQNMNRINSSSH